MTSIVSTCRWLVQYSIACGDIHSYYDIVAHNAGKFIVGQTLITRFCVMHDVHGLKFQGCNPIPPPGH